MIADFCQRCWDGAQQIILSLIIYKQPFLSCCPSVLLLFNDVFPLFIFPSIDSSLLYFRKSSCRLSLSVVSIYILFVITDSTIQLAASRATISYFWLWWVSKTVRAVDHKNGADGGALYKSMCKWSPPFINLW